jgi:hypothetical protein
MKAQQDIVICGNSYYNNHQREQMQEKSYFPDGSAKNRILAVPNSKSTHVYNFQKYDKAFMIAITVNSPQK